MALLDHGEIVPTRGTTQSAAGFGGPDRLQDLCSLSRSTARLRVGRHGIDMAGRTQAAAGGEPARAAFSRSMRKAERAGWPSRTIMAVG